MIPPEHDIYTVCLYLTEVPRGDHLQVHLQFVGIILFLFYGLDVPCVQAPLVFLHSAADGQFAGFLATESITAIAVWVHVFYLWVFLKCVPRVGLLIL